MREDFANSTVTAEDLTHVLMTLTIEIVAQASPDPGPALERIASNLLDTGRKLPPENRSGQLLKSLAYHMMGTEPGA
jgi:hypothetical protein